MSSIDTGLKLSGSAIAINIVLALVKITAGIIGNSYALIADGIESTTDIVSSLVVWGGLRISLKPPDRDHPYGHGKAESIAGVVVAFSLLGAAAMIAFQSIREIRTPHHAPEWYTLVVLAGIILVKETLFRKISDVGNELDSSALKSDAWHHRSDAITSVAAFVGITIALIGGPGYEVADDWAALLACGIIVYNGVRLLLPALNEVMDGAVPDNIENRIREIAASVEGVLEIEKSRVRKSGLGLLMDIHVTVHEDLTVREGHKIGHDVKDRLLGSELNVIDVTVHIEPGNVRKTPAHEEEGS